ncbi:unnamed protein product [Caretta caretta]
MLCVLDEEYQLTSITAPAYAIVFDEGSYLMPFSPRPCQATSASSQEDHQTQRNMEPGENKSYSILVYNFCKQLAKTNTAVPLKAIPITQDYNSHHAWGCPGLRERVRRRSDGGGEEPLRWGAVEDAGCLLVPGSI